MRVEKKYDESRTLAIVNNGESSAKSFYMNDPGYGATQNFGFLNTNPTRATRTHEPCHIFVFIITGIGAGVSVLAGNRRARVRNKIYRIRARGL